MSVGIYNTLTTAILIAVLLCTLAAVASLALLFLRWRAPYRRRYFFGLILFVSAVPCLIGAQQVLLWKVFLPALGRERIAEYDAHRAKRLADSSLLQVGDAAPDFTITDVDDNTFSLREAKGKVVVINFFATWCGACLMELPHLEKLWRNYRECENFQLLVIDREEPSEVAREFRTTKGFTFPISADPQRRVYALFAEELIPRTIVVSAEGKIIYSSAGYDERDFQKLRELLAQHVHCQSPTPTNSLPPATP